MTRRITTFCRICEALCGLEAEVDDGRIIRLRPDQRHVATRGFACPKGLKQHALYQSPDRLTRPLKREGSFWRSLDWARAYREIGDQLATLRARYGPDSIALYLGTAGGFSVLHPIMAQGFFSGLGSRSTFAPATQDCSNKFAVAQQVYGYPFLQPFPDIDRTDCLIIVGANPAMSKWSFGHVPNAIARLREIEKRGGTVHIIDPRRTETARAVGQHHFIRPGTDVFFYLSFLEHVVAHSMIDRFRVDSFTEGFDAVKELATRWPAERTAEVTGIAADELRAMAEAYGRAQRAAIYCSTGVNMGGQGALAFWLQEVINAVTGNLDRRGGTIVGRSPQNMVSHFARAGALTRTDRSRIGGFRSVNDCYPGGILADEILTSGPGQIKALICTGGNPLLMMPGASRLREAFSELELLVVIDIFRNETAELAHYVLPATTPFERPDLIFLFPLIFGLQPLPYMQATRRVVPPAGESRDETTIFLDLARAAGVEMFDSPIAHRLLQLGRRSPQLQERMLSLFSLALGRGSLEGLTRRYPHGKKLPDHRGNDFLGERVLTENKKVQLAPAELLAEAEQLDALFQQEREADEPFRLITRRAVRTHNSWTHNAVELLGDKRTNYLYMHPDDAREQGFEEGDVVDVTTETASVRVPLKLLEELMRGVVALPHGWGHQHAPGMTVASATEGVNVNLLAADGPEALEPLSGMARLTGIPVRIEPAAGPRATGDWSGIAPDEVR